MHAPSSRNRRRAVAIAGGATLVLLAVAAYVMWDRGLAGGHITLDAFAPGTGHLLAQLTVADGVEQWLTWSPSGGAMAYVGESGTFRKIFVRFDRAEATGGDVWVLEATARR